MANGNDKHEIGSAAVELAECRKKLACLQTRAERLHRQMASAASILEECVKGSEADNPRAPSKHEPWPSYDDIVEVYEGCRETRQRIRELEERFRQWGVFPQRR